MNVLIAVDGSQYGEWATEWAAKIPFVRTPKIAAIHVVDTVSLRAPVMPQPVLIGIEPFIHQELKRLEAHAKKVVTDTKALLSSLKMKGRVILEKGAVAPSILKHAAKRGGLIIVGSRGLDALDRFMLGSVSTRVTTHASCSVLVVKEPPRPIQRMLLAVDGSKASTKTLNFLRSTMSREASGASGASGPITVAVMHVMPFLKYPEIKEAGKALVRSYADKLTKAGYEVEEILKLGNPADEIIKATQEHKADLIIAGAKGLGAIARFLLGSVSTKLVQHSSCSVLVVR